jgi:hypothetical protein
VPTPVVCLEQGLRVPVDNRLRFAKMHLELRTHVATLTASVRKDRMAGM